MSKCLTPPAYQGILRSETACWMHLHPDHPASRPTRGVATNHAHSLVRGVRTAGLRRQRHPSLRVAGATLLLAVCLLPPASAGLVLPTEARAMDAHRRFLDLRREALQRHDASPYSSPAAARIVVEHPDPWKVESHQWHHQITATVFWVGEQPTPRNPTPNTASSWDPRWAENFGGVDDPVRRNGYAPAGFTPRLNPFYIALPYNDLTSNGTHRPEAPDVIPWFWDSYRGSYGSVCEDRWVAIHHRGRVCFAQWKDAGPFRTDDWEYVFKGRKPKANPNQNAGIDLSPAVRDFLGIRGKAKVDWRFVENNEIRQGPWAPWAGGNPTAGP